MKVCRAIVITFCAIINFMGSELSSSYRLKFEFFALLSCNPNGAFRIRGWVIKSAVYTSKVHVRAQELWSLGFAALERACAFPVFVTIFATVPACLWVLLIPWA